jgi:hypothetical protein
MTDGQHRELGLATSPINYSGFYRPCDALHFGAFCLRGGGPDLWCCAGLELFCFGGFDSDARAAGLWLFSELEVADDPLLFAPVLVAFGFVNGRNPSLEFPLFACVDPTRASFGDMAGA